MSEGEEGVPLSMVVGLLAGIWLLTLLFSSLSALLERSGPIRLRHWADNAGGALHRLFHRSADFEAFRYLIAVSAALAPACLIWTAWFFLGPTSAPIAWIALAILLSTLIAVEWVNKRLVEWHAEKALERLTVPLRIVHTLLRFPVWLLSGYVPYDDDQEAEEEDDDDEASEGEIKAFMDVGVREGILLPDELELVRSVVDFSDTQVRSVMTPRVEIAAASVTTSLEELAEIFFETKHARLPLYGESIDQIVGILHIRDLFEALRKGRSATPAELCLPPHYVPESKPLGVLLQELQSNHQQMAIVVDEYGGVAGLVTVEDLVEEIVGEISDEHETPEPDRILLEDGGWMLDGRLQIDELTELFAVDFEDLPYETLSGLICGELGHVPRQGEVFVTHGLEMTIDQADERRVTSVAVRHAEIVPEKTES